MAARPEDAAVSASTADLLFSAWNGTLAARRRLADGAPAETARRAYRVMLRATQALLWVRHRRRFRVPAAVHAAFWEHFARPDAGRVDPELHRWLLEAYALCGRDGTVPAPRVPPEAAALALERAQGFLEAVHRHLGRRPLTPPAAAGGVSGGAPAPVRPSAPRR